MLPGGGYRRSSGTGRLSSKCPIAMNEIAAQTINPKSPAKAGIPAPNQKVRVMEMPGFAAYFFCKYPSKKNAYPAT